MQAARVMSISHSSGRDECKQQGSWQFITFHVGKDASSKGHGNCSQFRLGRMQGSWQFLTVHVGKDVSSKGHATFSLFRLGRVQGARVMPISHTSGKEEFKKQGSCQLFTVHVGKDVSSKGHANFSQFS